MIPFLESLSRLSRRGTFVLMPFPTITRGQSGMRVLLVPAPSTFPWTLPKMWMGHEEGSSCAKLLDYKMYTCTDALGYTPNFVT